MAKTNYLIKEKTLTDIADAIREKRSYSNTMTPLEMPNEIRQIETGNGGYFFVKTLSGIDVTYPVNFTVTSTIGVSTYTPVNFEITVEKEE